MNAKKKPRLTRLVTGLLLLTLTFVAQVQATGSHASGGGTYFVKPGILSEFQLSESHVECKIGHGILADGTVLQMWMFSTSIDSVSVDSAAQSVDISGTMISIVTLHFTDGTSARLRETVPFLAHAEDNGTPGAGEDFFSLTVDYTDTPDLDQFDLFGSPATFSGTLETGDVKVR
jgi:hypothetical protein